MDQQAFILRIAPSGIDRVPQALKENKIIIGWAYAEGLLDPELTWEQFREIIRNEYYNEETNYELHPAEDSLIETESYDFEYKED